MNGGHDIVPGRRVCRHAFALHGVHQDLVRREGGAEQRIDSTCSRDRRCRGPAHTGAKRDTLVYIEPKTDRSACRIQYSFRSGERAVLRDLAWQGVNQSGDLAKLDQPRFIQAICFHAVPDRVEGEAEDIETDTDIANAGGRAGSRAVGELAHIIDSCGIRCA